MDRIKSQFFWVALIMMILFIVSSVAAVDVNGPVAPPKVKSFENAGFASVSSPSQVSAIVYSPKAGFASGDTVVSAAQGSAIVGSGSVVEADKVSKVKRLTSAPMNPAYVKYIKNPGAWKHYGYIPTPLTEPTGKNIISSSPSISDPVYDLRKPVKVGYRNYIPMVSKVKDQGDCNSGWAFAAIASLEGNLLKTKYKEYDLSENSLKNEHLYDAGPCGGGNNDFAMGTFGRWHGPFNEVDDPYYPGAIKTNGLDEDSVQLIDASAGRGVVKVQDVYTILADPTTVPNPGIKSALIEFGPVTASFYYDDSAYDLTNHSYRYNGTSTSSNHAVAIVGWNDTYSADKFVDKPSANGAWIVKNSRGTTWGDKGYFYVSYYDKFMGKANMAVFTAGNEKTMTGASCTGYSSVREYQYDILGRTNQFGCGSNTEWGANIFIAQNNGPITAVSSYFAKPNSEYTIEIYKLAGTSVTNPRSGTLSNGVAQSGTMTWPGYHTIKLTTPVKLTKGDVFSVVMKYTTPGYNYPLPTEQINSGYSTKGVQAGAGKSFYSSDGSVWADFSTSTPKGDVTLKAFQAY